jgi:hypothetical protein
VETITNFYIALAIFLLVAVSAWLWQRFSRRPSKRDHRYTNMFGQRRRRIKYYDTGKQVDQVYRTNWRGQRVKDTYVTKTCYRCGKTVTNVKNGVYQCTCGNRFR